MEFCILKVKGMGCNTLNLTRFTGKYKLKSKILELSLASVIHMRAMASEQGMSSWTDLLHSSTKLLEQAAPSAQFPPLQVLNLDQLEALSKKLKAKTLRTDAPSQSIAATRLLAREGINAEQLTRDLKSFELKVSIIFHIFIYTTFEDVFPAEATSVEEYLYGLLPLADKPVVEKKVSVYAEVVRNLNNARQQGLPFKACTIRACGNFAVLGTAGVGLRDSISNLE
ncbi:hypothetical protein PVK06_047289 [Gossypium arboreum]|uniref:Uncharacterized protein n=1 Tax=Gossypium arboreum TaxID=29729 RepID=A0ABR0MD12_GOSAR|nr:hypothetical protein PVK06_047289 [Gossypium arboreum]